MIEFMILALPRCGTTWAANWLTTDTTLCIHDPLFKYHYTELDNIKSDKILGISCTGIHQFPEWVNDHPARKVILYRDLEEINNSLRKAGLHACTRQQQIRLSRVKGYRLPWTDLFDNPQGIHEYLLGKPFDSERHAELININIQPMLSRLTIDKQLMTQLVEEMQGATSCHG